jgi:uroporphyrinogen decarboxylase
VPAASQNTLFQRALRREILEVPPVWMMRQAGRYHQHYQSLRKKHSFMDLCKKADLAAEVAMGPIREFDFDAAILFSDLLFPLETLGMPLTYDPGPKLGWNLSEEKQLLSLKSVDAALKGLHFQAEALAETRKVLPSSKSLIGFVGGPWTLFVYAVEGSHKGGLKKSMGLSTLYAKYAEIMLPLLKKNIELQLDAGAEIVMIFDTAAGDVTAEFFAKYLKSDLLNLLNSSQEKKIGYYMRGGTTDHYDLLSDSQAAGFGYEHSFDIKERILNAKSGFVQGNFNQEFLTLDTESFQREFDKWLSPLLTLPKESRAGWVAGLGHGITPLAKESNVKLFVQNMRKAFR